MSTLNGQGFGNLEAYGKTGPYGELLWYLLGSFKYHFIDLWIKEWGNDLYELAAQVRNLLRREIEGTRQKMKQLKEPWLEQVLKAWPRDRKTSAEQLRGLAETRWAQLELYLGECLSLANLISPEGVSPSRRQSYMHADQSAVEREVRRTLAEAVGMLIWPYYFIRYDDGEQDRKITWLPGFEMLQLKVFPPLNSEYAGNNLLYPSLGMMISDRRSDERTRQLADHLSVWVDKGESDLRKRGGDIGHVQPFLPGPNTYFHDVWQTAHQRSRFSDLFYLNREAFRWFEVPVGTRATADDACGVVYWCSPIDGLLLELMRPSTVIPRLDRDVDEGDTTHPYADWVRKLGKLTRDAWSRCNGPVVGEQIRRRYQVTQEQVLAKSQRLAEAAVSATAGLLCHEIANFLRCRRVSDPVERIIAVDTCADLVLQAAATLSYRGETNSRTHAMWDSLCSHEGLSQGTFEHVIRLVFSSSLPWNQVSLSLKFDALLGKEVHKLLPAVLFELIRNVCSHADPKTPRHTPRGTVAVEAIDGQAVRVTTHSGLHSLSTFKGIYQWLPASEDDKPQKGLAIILVLLREMGCGSSQLAQWKYVPCRDLEGPPMTCRYESIDAPDESWRLLVPEGCARYIRGEEREPPPTVPSTGIVECETGPLLRAMRH